MTSGFLRTVGFRLEAGLLLGLIGLVRLLPVQISSALGAGVLRVVGPWLPPHRIGRRNLERAFPDLSPADIDKILSGMWQNLGRTAGEFVKLDTIAQNRDTFVAPLDESPIAEIVEAGGPIIFVSAHMANWEILWLASTLVEGPMDFVYRAPNNPFLASLYRNRGPNPESRLIPKGPKGAVELLKSLRAGRHLGMLVDQKLREGIAVPFFGRDALSTDAYAQLAVRFKCPVVPTRIERIGPVRFRIELSDPILPPDGSDRDVAVQEIVLETNRRIEDWVRERPEQWLWVHKRWPD